MTIRLIYLTLENKELKFAVVDLFSVQRQFIGQTETIGQENFEQVSRNLLPSNLAFGYFFCSFTEPIQRSFNNHFNLVSGQVQ